MRRFAIALIASLFLSPWAFAQTVPAAPDKATPLAPVQVRGQAYTSSHGGYLISGDFKVDPRMPYIVFPAQALVANDILSIEPVHLQDDEYLVLQECASADCQQADLVRVWNADGVATAAPQSENRIRIRHENKYFIWIKRLPLVASSDCMDCRGHFYEFKEFSPPMTLIPDGEMAAYHAAQLAKAWQEPPEKAVSETHEGSTFVVTYENGSSVRIRRMHAADGN